MKCSVALLCHAQAPSALVRDINVEVEYQAQGDLRLCFTLIGDVDQLHILEPQSAQRADGLWRHTCFEAFVGLRDEPGYHEFNFSPSGQWAAYAFSAYRDGGTLRGEIDPAIQVQRLREQLSLTTRIAADLLPKGVGDLRLGLSAVIEAADGALSYWALKHPAPQPDFHHADSFVLTLSTLKNQAA